MRRAEPRGAPAGAGGLALVLGRVLRNCYIPSGARCRGEEKTLMRIVVFLVLVLLGACSAREADRALGR